MAPKTRTRKSLPSTSHQSTLSFNNKSTRVTKSSATTPSVSDRKASSKLNEIAQEDALEQFSEPETATTVTEFKPELGNETDTDEVKQHESEDKSKHIKKFRTSTGSTASTKEEFESVEAATTAAQKVSDAKIQKYWKAEEDARIAPRVHQEGLSVHEKILRHFDLSSQYGPCIGIPRLNRWKRAYTLKFNPPIEVLAVLLKEEAKGADRGEKRKGSNQVRQCGRLAYVDELGGGKAVLVD